MSQCLRRCCSSAHSMKILFVINISLLLYLLYDIRKESKPPEISNPRGQLPPVFSISDVKAIFKILRGTSTPLVLKEEKVSNAYAVYKNSKSPEISNTRGQLPAVSSIVNDINSLLSKLGATSQPHVVNEEEVSNRYAVNNESKSPENSNAREQLSPMLSINEINSLFTAIRAAPPPHVVNDEKVSNPEAVLSTSMVGNAMGHDISKAYMSGGFYWSTNVNIGDYIDITLGKPIRLYRIVIPSGHESYKGDTLLDSALLISSAPYGDKCAYYQPIKEFRDTPVIDLTFPETPIVKCIRLEIRNIRVVSDYRRRWLVIRDISIN